ncbi:MAG: Asp-tRNA(Asn)/Glu-tRNA(Gln) amidotransferase subunit GatA [Patescibacteria group bacterium]
MSDFSHFTIKSFSEGLRAKKFSARETTQELFAHIKETDKKIGAYLSLDEEGALKDAEHVDRALAEGQELDPLAGVPLAIKDNILVKGLPATAGSRILKNYIANYDAGVIKKLKSKHAIFLGKTNLDEFAMGSSTENSAFQITRNPHDLKRVPGGSSGGSAAAVAAHLALAALGSDTGGSIRQPASLCGVVGLKPTYGVVSRSGLIALASSLDQIGPITKTVEDAALLFQGIAGHDKMDATSSKTTYQWKEFSNPQLEKIKQMKVGLPKEYFATNLTKEMDQALDETIHRFEHLGIQFKTISLPHTKYALSCYYIILPAEASSNLARFDGVRYARIDAQNPDHQHSNLKEIYLKQRGLGFGSEVKRRIILGTFVLSSGYYDAYYKKAQQVRSLIARDFDRAFKEVDVIFAPTTPTSAFAIGEKTADPLSMYLSDIFTIPVNLAGLPAISIPIQQKISENEAVPLPIGFQLIGKHFREADILGLGQLYEKS